MADQPLLYIGLMSGTSIDAVDAVLLSISGTARNQLEIESHHSTPIPASLQKDVRTLFYPGDDSIDLMGSCDLRIARLFAKTALELIRSQGLECSDITAIGSHGQTIRHRPDSKNPDNHFTVQLGDPNLIAALTGITTVADFRRKDMALGGQGAPLVPAFHRHVFSHDNKDRAIINIGGIANISWLPAKNCADSVLGFDSGPGNCLMDGWIQRHRGEHFDDRGSWAASGLCHTELLNKLLAEPYLQLLPPKSTGREIFNLSWLESIISTVKTPIEPNDVQATLCEFTATTIAMALEQLPNRHLENIYLCGGGVRNSHLIQRLRKKTPRATISTTADAGIDPQQVESAAFAWLAHQALNRLPGNIPSVTGASREAVLGGIYFP